MSVSTVAPLPEQGFNENQKPSNATGEDKNYRANKELRSVILLI